MTRSAYLYECLTCECPITAAERKRNYYECDVCVAEAASKRYREQGGKDFDQSSRVEGTIN